MNWTLTFAALIGVIYPIYCLVHYNKISDRIKRDSRFRLMDYKQLMIIFWSLTILVIINHFLTNTPPLDFYPNFTTVGIVLSILVVVFSIMQYKGAHITSEALDATKNTLKEGYFYLPKTKQEFNWFVILSISAGICEEIIFRLFLFEFLNENMGLLTAFLLTNIVFAITHFGTGMQNMISAFFLGLVFSAVYYFSENIWIAVLLHIAIDVNGGILGYRVRHLEQEAIKNANP